MIHRNRSNGKVENRCIVTLLTKEMGFFCQSPWALPKTKCFASTFSQILKASLRQPSSDVAIKICDKPGLKWIDRIETATRLGNGRRKNTRAVAIEIIMG